MQYILVKLNNIYQTRVTLDMDKKGYETREQANQVAQRLNNETFPDLSITSDKLGRTQQNQALEKEHREKNKSIIDSLRRKKT